MSRQAVALPTLDELSEIAAENNPNRRAFADVGGRSVTWGEFEEESRRAADAYADHVRQGDRVALLCESSVDTTVLWNGALKAGAVVSYVHTQAAPETVRYSIDELAPKVLVVSETHAAFLADRVWDDLTCDPTVVVVGEATRKRERSYESFVADATPSTPDVTPESDDIAVVAWTSGTTGKPKGWCHTHRGIVLKGLISDVSRTTTQLSTAQTSFMAWYGNVISILIAGGSVVFMPDWEPTAWVDAVETYDATRAGMVPTMWRAILDLDLDERDLSSLESISFVGEKMDRTTLTRLRDRICENVVNHYASTELIISRIKVEEMDGKRLESVGKPFDGTRVRIVEPGGGPTDAVERGETGEILVKGADCPVWAWGRTDKLDEEFTDGWWHSGDLGYRDEDGYLYLEGRADFMIKSKGVKVIPTPIEERLNAHRDVAEALVVGIEDEEYGQKVTAVVKRSDPDLAAETLDQWCLDGDKIARFERPREYVFTEEPLPRTPSQKLDRKTAMKNLAE